jgi:hypothetical protein
VCTGSGLLSRSLGIAGSFLQITGKGLDVDLDIGHDFVHDTATDCDQLRVVLDDVLELLNQHLELLDQGTIPVRDGLVNFRLSRVSRVNMSSIVLLGFTVGVNSGSNILCVLLNGRGDNRVHDLGSRVHTESLKLGNRDYGGA